MQDLANENLNIVLYSEDEKLSNLWSRAFELWISNYKSTSTQRSYKDTWRIFINFCHLAPWRIGRSIVVEFVNFMKQNELSDSTIQLRISALSSFYEFVTRDFTVISKEGQEVPLFNINPASSKILRKRSKPYIKAQYLTKEEIKQFLSVLDRNTIQGARDYSLFLSYFLTGRRNSELRKMKWGDIEVEDGVVLYYWSGKNVELKRAEIPRPAYEAICDYLRVSKRLDAIGKDDYVFIAIDEYTEKVPAVQNMDSTEIAIYRNRPLSLREVDKLIKKYCKLAGITKRISSHGLRHSATVLRRNAGETIEEVSKFLNHASFTTTNVYLHSLEGTRDRAWKKVSKSLDL